MNSEDPNTLGHFFENITTSMLSVIIALIGFWSAFIKNLVNRHDVEKMIEKNNSQSPYAQDRQVIMERLQANKEMQNLLSKTLERNTEVMTELKIQIATLGTTLENLETRIEKNL